jgi:hypothetical protein
MGQTSGDGARLSVGRKEAQATRNVEIETCQGLEEEDQQLARAASERAWQERLERLHRPRLHKARDQ